MDEKIVELLQGIQTQILIIVIQLTCILIVVAIK